MVRCDTTSDKLEKRIDSGYLDTSVNGREAYFAIVIVLILMVELNAIFMIQVIQQDL